MSIYTDWIINGYDDNVAIYYIYIAYIICIIWVKKKQTNKKLICDELN